MINNGKNNAFDEQILTNALILVKNLKYNDIPEFPFIIKEMWRR